MTAKAHHRRATSRIRLTATVYLHEDGHTEVRNVRLLATPPVIVQPDLEGRPRDPWFEGGIWVSDPDRTQRDRQAAAAITAATETVMSRLRQAVHGQVCACCVDNECECEGTYLIPA